MVLQLVRTEKTLDKCLANYVQYLENELLLDDEKHRKEMQKQLGLFPGGVPWETINFKQGNLNRLLQLDIDQLVLSANALIRTIDLDSKITVDIEGVSYNISIFGDIQVETLKMNDFLRTVSGFIASIRKDCETIGAYEVDTSFLEEKNREGKTNFSFLTSFIRKDLAELHNAVVNTVKTSSDVATRQKCSNFLSRFIHYYRIVYDFSSFLEQYKKVTTSALFPISNNFFYMIDPDIVDMFHEPEEMATTIKEIEIDNLSSFDDFLKDSSSSFFMHHK